MKARLLPITMHYVACPVCGENTGNYIDHLEKKPEWKAGPWFCDGCGGSYLIKRTHEGVEIEVWKETMGARLAFLRNGDIGLVVEGSAYNNDDEGHMRYYYDEHTCPTNYVDNIVAVVDLKTGDDDPHGIFKFCGAIEPPEGYNECNFNWEPYLGHFG